MSVVVLGNTDFVALAAGVDNVLVRGPVRQSELGAYEIEDTLRALAAGELRIIADEDGDPRLVP